MKKIENLCVHCEICVHCGQDKATVFVCDNCGEEYEPNELYDYDGEDLCKDCLVQQFLPISVTKGWY